MVYDEKEAISFDDVTILTQYSDIDSRSNVDLSAPNHSYPFISSPMYHLDTDAMAEFCRVNNFPFVLHRYFPSSVDQLERWNELVENMPNAKNTIFLAVGSNEKWIGDAILKGVKNFCVDMAHGNSIQAIKSVEFIKSYCPDSIIMAGNIESYDGFKRLYTAGARYFRVCIGSGSICSTNINTGYGLPILTALAMIYDKMSTEERENSFLIADGGIRTAGDIAKALAFGASYVMCGKLFASTSCARGPFFGKELNLLMDQTDIEDREDIFYVEYAGMASKLMREMAGGSQKTDVSEEGKAGLIEYTGTTENVFNQVVSNLRAVLAYSGCRTIPEFKRDAVLRRVAPGGKLEKQIHLSKIYR